MAVIAGILPRSNGSPRQRVPDHNLDVTILGQRRAATDPGGCFGTKL
jgi:hypothetical protein